MPSTPAPTRHGVRAFLVVTFGLTWLPFLPVLVGGPAVPLLMPFAPAIAAVVVRRSVTEEGFADLGLRPRVQEFWTWPAVAPVWPLVAMPLAVAAASVLGVGPPDLGRVDILSLAVALTGGTGNAWLPRGPSVAIVAAEAVVLLTAVLVGARGGAHGRSARGAAAPRTAAAAR